MFAHDKVFLIDRTVEDFGDGGRCNGGPWIGEILIGVFRGYHHAFAPLRTRLVDHLLTEVVEDACPGAGRIIGMGGVGIHLDEAYIPTRKGELDVGEEVVDGGRRLENVPLGLALSAEAINGPSREHKTVIAAELLIRERVAVEDGVRGCSCEDARSDRSRRTYRSRVSS